MKKPIASYIVPIVSNDFRISRKFVLDLFESQFLIDRLLQHNGNVADAAEASNLTEEEFKHLLKQHHLNAEKFRA